MKNTALVYVTAALVAPATCFCYADCPLPQEVQDALENCSSMQWLVLKPGMHSKPSYDRFPVEAEDAAVIKDLLLHRLQAAPSRKTREGQTCVKLCLLDGNGEVICTLPLCHIAPESEVQRHGTLTYGRYYLSDVDHTTLTRLFVKAQGITEEPQGNAPAREELIRRYNLGGAPYNAQTHIITYKLVSGKELMDSHRPILGGLDIQADKTYGIARVFKPRNEPSTGGGDLTVIYDPGTGAILYAKKSR